MPRASTRIAMQAAQATLAVAALLSMALAGCSGDSASGGISVSGSDGTYKFTGPAGADNYTWDLGDHLTKAYTRTVEHTYDFANGVVPVTLTTTKGEKKAEHRKEVTLGTGANTNAGFVLEGSINWTVLGAPVTLSAHRSSDPDGDPLRYTWSCQRAGDAVRQTAHTHAGFGGVPFATPAAGSIISINAQGPLPAADRTVQGDLCDGLGQGARPSLDTTITGSFAKSGIYDIYLLASDPVHPTTSGKYRVIVTPEAEKPQEKATLQFNGSFMLGSAGTLQGVCESAGQCTDDFDRVTHHFNLALAAQHANMTLAYEDPSGAMDISCQLRRGETPLETVHGTDAEASVLLDPANLRAGSYSILCQPTAGVPTSPDGTPYTVTIDYDLDMDPFKVY